jgi:5-methylcytosine-specific restriction enzyme subunit McrC
MSRSWTTFDRIEDLFGTVLARGISRIARRGLDRSYVLFQEELAGVRGKIELGETIKRTSLTRQRLVCAFEDLSTDVIHNQIIASTLSTLATNRRLDPGVRSEVRLAASRMRGVSIRPISRQLFSRVHLDRNRRAYRFLINVCRLLHDIRLVDERSGENRFADVDLTRMSMWRVFESFAARFYDREQREYAVSPQASVQWWALETRGPRSQARIPAMRPDLVLESAARRVILDTKFYRDGGLGDDVNSRLHAGNLYQLFAYVMNRERSHPAGPRHEGILLYPTVGEETRVEFVTHEHRFQARSVDLGRPWREIHDAMLEVLA